MSIEAYTAGFLDADGSVSLVKFRSDSDWLRMPQVAFYNCDKSILKQLQKEWGGNIRANKPTSKKHNVSYSLHLINNNALALLERVLPHMLHTKKKKRAELISANYKKCTPRNGKYTAKQIVQKKRLAKRVMGIEMRGAGAW